MIKVFLKHLIYEKCINIIFDGITRSFTKPLQKYEIVNVQLINENGVIKRRYTFKYDGKLNTVEVGSSSNLREVLASEHGLTENQIDRELDEIVEDVIEMHIRDMETGYDKIVEEMLNEKSDGKYVMAQIDGNIETIKFDELPPEIQEQLKILPT